MAKTGQELADEGIQQAIDNANEEWKNAARSAVRIICRKRGVGGEFTSDAVNAILDRLDVRTHTNNAMGGIFRSMASEGWIEHTGRHIKSLKPSAHARPIAVWKILKV